MNRLLSLLCLLLVVAALNGCATNPATGKKDFVLRSKESDAKVGAEVHPQILTQYGVYGNSELQTYVNDIGQKLAAVSDWPELDYSFIVLDDDLVNAFALPGGFIYVTRGLLAHLNTEAELAAVLGHEIGHVTARHSATRESRSKLAGLGAAVANVASRGLAGGAANLVGGAWVSGYNREQELEADALGAKYLAKAGYSTDAVFSAVDLLKRQEQFEIERARIEGREARVPKGIFSTHPDNDLRFEEAVAAAKEYKSDVTLDDNRDLFLDKINGIKWGPKRSAGVFRNNLFYNARFGVKIRLPDQWRADGEPSRVVAISPDNTNQLTILALRFRKGMTPEQVMQKALNIPSYTDGKEVTVSGMPAYIAMASRFNSAFGPRPARVAAITDTRRGLAYVFAGTGRRDLGKVSADREYIGTIFSTDRMTREEASLAQPPVVKVVEAESNTTISSLAKDSALPAFAEQRLRLINGLYPSGEPEAGKLIKTID